MNRLGWYLGFTLFPLIALAADIRGRTLTWTTLQSA